MITEKRKLLQLVAAVLLAVMLLTACASGASKAADKIELGQKYLTELNYTEAVASFTEAIRLDPDNIQAYMGRAEAYLALGEYEKALEDYRFVSQKTEEMPYTRAISYMGQAEVYEKIDKQDRALADYGLAKVLLTASDVGKAESVSEDDIKIKLVEALYAHAMLSEKIKVYDNALEDYEELLKLGEKVEAKRGEILSQLGESIEEENGLLGTEADKVASEPNTEEPIEEKLTEEPAAEQKASSASESQPASEETKPEEPASSSKQSQEEAASLQEEITEINWVEETVKSKYCSSVSVRYSIGAKSIQLLYDGEPKTYHLSAPLQSVQRVKKGDYEHFVFYVPEGTTVTADWSGVDGAMLRWIEVSHIFSEDELQNVNDSDVQMETSMTVRKNIMYQQVQEWDYVTHFSWVSDDGGIIFCAE